MRKILLMLVLSILLPPLYFSTDVVVTAYTPSVIECGKTDAVTASGVVAEEGVTIASDSLPFGTKVEIDGNVYEVQDRFGGGHVGKIDIFMWDLSEALNFGTQVKTVKVYY